MDKNFSHIKQRIKQFAINKGIPLGKFFESLEVVPSNFSGEKIKKGVNSDTIEKLISLYPEVDLQWLLTGDEKKENNIVLNEVGAVYKTEDNALTKEIKNLIKSETKTLKNVINDLNIKVNALMTLNEIDTEILDNKITGVKKKTKS